MPSKPTHQPVEVFEGSRTVSVTARLELRNLARGLFVYRQHLQTTSSRPLTGSTFAPPRVASPTMSSSGFVDDAGRATLLKGKPATNLPLEIVSDEIREMFRTEGYPDATDRLFKGKQEDPWTMFESDPSLTADNLLRLDHGSHMVFDRKGDVVPVAQMFDYISSRIDESSYDLLALARHLMTRPDIVVYSGKADRRKDLPPASSPKDAIFDIPYYNAEEGRRHSVEFRWQPTQKDFQRVWKACGGKYPSTQIHHKFFELDIAGIKQFSLEEKTSPRSTRRRPR